MENHIHYLPEKWFAEGDPDSRVVGPAYTADWWIEEQIKLDNHTSSSSSPEPEIGHFLIVIVAASDATQLTNLIGDQELNPVNFTLANFDSEIRQCPTRAAWRCVGLLPQNLKYSVSADNPKEEQRQTALAIVHWILYDIFIVVNRLYEKGMKVVCPDGKIRIGHPVLSGWIADYIEALKIFGIVSGSCPVCQIPPGE
ncbi:hypothetical protein BJ508DRAFT_216751, partial [Ascobolus immersus RN42]